MFIFYDCILLFAALIYLPFIIINGKWHKEIIFRLGFLGSGLINKLSKRNNIWIHAVSVGEVMAVVDLVRGLKIKYPDCRIIFSTCTKTGNFIAKQQFKNDIVIYAPLDFSWVVRKYLKIIKPIIYISAETEIWPNLYSHLNKQDIPIIQVNGRISDKSFRRYKIFRYFIHRALDCVTAFCMQSQIDADRIMSLGVSKRHIRIVGNLKFDNQSEIESISKKDLSFLLEDIILMAGSTHHGEEKIIIDVYKELLSEFCNLRLIIAPRHIERISAVEDILKENNLDFVKFPSGLKQKNKICSVVLVSEIGHLRKLYSISDIVFIGKTFKVGGGQNMIEPLSFGKPTFVGPLTQNFKSVVEILQREDVIFVVDNPLNLAYEIKKILNDPDRIREIEIKAKKVIKDSQGATAKTIIEIEKILKV